jgi:RNA polymerase sigma-70 factor, ECF subfamily
VKDFQSIYQASAARVLALGQKLLGQQQEAEDVMQDVFLELWRRSADFNADRGSEEAWVRTIARNRVVDRVRRCARQKMVLERIQRESSEVLMAFRCDTGEGCLDRDSIGAAIASLPAKQQEVLRLAYFEDRSHAEIALLISTPLGTVKTRLRMALERLCRSLADGNATPAAAEGK